MRGGHRPDLGELPDNDGDVLTRKDAQPGKAQKLKMCLRILAPDVAGIRAELRRLAEDRLESNAVGGWGEIDHDYSFCRSDSLYSMDGRKKVVAPGSNGHADPDTGRPGPAYPYDPPVAEPQKGFKDLVVPFMTDSGGGEMVIVFTLKLSHASRSVEELREDISAAFERSAEEEWESDSVGMENSLRGLGYVVSDVNTLVIEY